MLQSMGSQRVGHNRTTELKTRNILKKKKIVLFSSLRALDSLSTYQRINSLTSMLVFFGVGEG